MKPVSPEKRCAKQVYSGGSFHGHRCTRLGILEHGGKLWCTQHYPPNVEARDQSRHAQWEREWAERDWQRAEAKRSQAELERKAAAYDRLVAELDRWDKLQGPMYTVIPRSVIREILDGK